MNSHTSRLFSTLQFSVQATKCTNSVYNFGAFARIWPLIFVNDQRLTDWQFPTQTFVPALATLLHGIVVDYTSLIFIAVRWLLLGPLFRIVPSLEAGP